MFSNKILSFLKNFFFLIFVLAVLQSCGALKFKRSDVKDNPINDAEKREKNVREGRGISIGGDKGRSGSFDFATSNEMWRAAMDVLDFVPLTTADYGGGIIITDWYSDDLNSQESVKIMINFLTNEIRADGLKVKIYKKVCNDKQKCNTQLMTSELDNEIKLAVLKKAAQLKNQDAKKKGEDSDYRVTPTGD
tara:strand:+ start:801 stop:1376 length:576 start_codon:yes stop_codon:yes gene_type:complete